MQKLSLRQLNSWIIKDGDSCGYFANPLNLSDKQISVHFYDDHSHRKRKLIRK